MTWNNNYIGSRRATKGRDRRIGDFESIKFVVNSEWFGNSVEQIQDQHPPAETGRPRVHAVSTVLLLKLMANVLGSSRKAAVFLRERNNWKYLRKILSAAFPDEPLLRPGTPKPSRSMIQHYKKVFTADFLQQIQKTMELEWIKYADEMGLGINHGTKLDVSRNATLFGDSGVIRAMSRYKKGDVALNRRTGELQQRRYDQNATWHATGDNRRIYGNHFVHIGAFTGVPHEQIIFSVQPLWKGRDVTEADIAVEMASTIHQQIPGFAALTWDKAVRSKHIEQIWKQGIQPVIGVYDKTNLSTERVPLPDVKANGVNIKLLAYKGAVCIIDANGDPQPLEPIKLEYQANKHSLRPYTTYRIPNTINCDTRLWNQMIKVRMTSPRGSDITRGEYIRALVPGSDRWKETYSIRSLAESTNSWYKNLLQRGERARSLTQVGQWLDLLLMSAWRNCKSLILFRRRTHNPTTDLRWST